MEQKHKDIRDIQREATAFRVFVALFLLLGLIVLAAQVLAAPASDLLSVTSIPLHLR